MVRRPNNETCAKTDVKLRSYPGHEIPVVGEAKVQVWHRNQEALLPVIITENDGPVLMARLVVCIEIGLGSN